MADFGMKRPYYDEWSPFPPPRQKRPRLPPPLPPQSMWDPVGSRNHYPDMHPPGFSDYGNEGTGYNRPGMHPPGYSDYGNEDTGYNRPSMHPPGFSDYGNEDTGYNRPGMHPPGFSDYGNEGIGYNRPCSQPYGSRGGFRGNRGGNMGQRHAKDNSDEKDSAAAVAKDSSIDFTDDYSAFYGKSNRGRGDGAQSYGHTRGAGGHQGSGGATQKNAASNPEQGTSKMSYHGNRGTKRGSFGNRGGAQRGKIKMQGMPPNHFGHGNGKEYKTETTQFVPPVHSLAKPTHSFLDVANMSVAEKLHRFCLFLRNEDSIKVNAVQTIMNAITSSKLGLTVHYNAEELAKVANRILYSGVLQLENVFLARSVGPNKKDLKQDVFLRALNVMLSKTVAEIYNLVDPGPDAIRKELMEQLESESKAEKETTQLTEAESFEQALLRWANAIKNMTSRPDSAVTVIEQAANQEKCVLRHQYSSEVVHMANGQQVFVGKISFGSVVVGRGCGLSKKGAKADTYKKTLDNVMKKSESELKESEPEEELKDLLNDPRIPVNAQVSIMSRPMEERFADLVRSLASKGHLGGTVNPLDVTAIFNGFRPMMIYRSPVNATNREHLICELYLDKIFIASYEGTRKQCPAKVYGVAWEVLTTTDSNTILTQHRCLTDDDLKQPDIVQVIVKGGGKTSESNKAGLRRYGFEMSDIDFGQPQDLVIVEHHDWAEDRRANAFCILQFTCTSNGQLLQWDLETAYEPGNSGGTYKCTMIIQKKEMGMSYGNTKAEAKNRAAADALFKMYETHPVVKVQARDDEDSWIPWETIVKEAEEMRKADDKKIPLETEDAVDNPSPDLYIMKVLTTKLIDYAASKEGELVFGPGTGLAEVRQLRTMAKNLNLKCDTQHHMSKPYLLFYEKLTFPEMVARMRQSGKQFGKYVLVPRTELPTHADVEDLVIH